MSEWQKIETAPKDGSVVIVYWPHEVLNGVEISYFHSHFNSWQSRAGGRHETRQPTHWMPLPAPPVLENEQKASMEPAAPIPSEAP